MNVVCRSAIIILMSRPQLAVLVLIVYNTTAFALGKSTAYYYSTADTLLWGHLTYRSNQIVFLDHLPSRLTVTRVLTRCNDITKNYLLL